MSNFILTDVQFYYNGVNIAGTGNAFTLDEDIVMEDNATLLHTSHSNHPGQPKVKFSFAGFTELGATSIEAQLAGIRAAADATRQIGIPILISKTGDAGNRAHFFKAQQANLKVLGGENQKIQGYSIDGTGGSHDHGLIDGYILEPGKVSRTASGQSATLTMPAVSATQRLFAIIHVLAFVGTSVSLKIQSDDNTGFTTPIDRWTRVASAVGATYEVPLGPAAITDTKYRLDWSGTFTSFKAAVAIGIR